MNKFCVGHAALANARCVNWRISRASAPIPQRALTRQSPTHRDARSPHNVQTKPNEAPMDSSHKNRSRDLAVIRTDAQLHTTFGLISQKLEGRFQPFLDTSWGTSKAKSYSKMKSEFLL